MLVCDRELMWVPNHHFCWAKSSSTLRRCTLVGVGLNHGSYFKASKYNDFFRFFGGVSAFFADILVFSSGRFFPGNVKGLWLKRRRGLASGAKVQLGSSYTPCSENKEPPTLFAKKIR